MKFQMATVPCCTFLHASQCPLLHGFKHSTRTQTPRVCSFMQLDVALANGSCDIKFTVMRIWDARAGSWLWSSPMYRPGLRCQVITLDCCTEFRKKHQFCAFSREFQFIVTAKKKQNLCLQYVILLRIVVTPMNAIQVVPTQFLVTCETKNFDVLGFQTCSRDQGSHYSEDTKIHKKSFNADLSSPVEELLHWSCRDTERGHR